jgi:hypothetical protein
MTNTMIINCEIGTTEASAPLGLEIWIDENKLFDKEHIQTTEQVTMELPEDEGEHELRFVMKNKTDEHTKIDESGNIISDARLTINNLMFDEIKLGQIFIDHSGYKHDFNGTGEQTQEKFFGEMGCNGTVSMRFSSPFYLWLLENI